MNLSKLPSLDPACIAPIVAALKRFAEFPDIVVPAVSAISNMVRSR